MNEEALAQFQEHFSHQNWEAARAVVESAIHEDPSDWNAIYLSGAIRRFQGDFHGAVAAYKRALALEAGFAEIWQALGVAEQQLGNSKLSIEALLIANELKPENYEIHTSLGITYSLAGDHKLAIRAHERALEICVNRAFAEIQKSRDKFFSVSDEPGGRTMKAKPEYFTAMKDILVTDFRYFNTIRNLAACYSDVGDDQKARALTEAAESCTPIEADLIGPLRNRQR